MLKLKKLSETYSLKVFTDSGDYFGDIEEAILASNKISGWKVKSTRNSAISRALGNAKGVIVPHNLVKAIGDIVIVSNSAVPSGGMGDDDYE